MSTLTAEQQRKIEENRQRALARRAERLAQGTRQQDNYQLSSSNVNACSGPNSAHFAARPSSGNCVTGGPSNAVTNRPIETFQPAPTNDTKQV